MTDQEDLLRREQVTPKVFVVDDDPSVRRAVSRLVRSAGFKVETFASAEEFLNRPPTSEPCCCLVLDVYMPWLTGLELQEVINRGDDNIPIVFITGHGDVPMSVRAMRAGAVDFLQKPFDDRDLLDAIERAIARDVGDRVRKAEIAEVRQRVNKLTPREYEVFTLVVSGMTNKQMAQKLGTSEKTVKIHRSRVMRKLGADTAIHLVRFAEKVGIHPPLPHAAN